MTWAATAVVGGGIAAGYLGGQSQEKAAGTASKAQIKASQMSIDEARRQFDQIRSMLAPFSQAGVQSIKAQQDLAGLNGPEAQRMAISSISSSPEMSALMQQGEEGILQNAAATGGLRGGNVQGALAQFRPQFLNQMIQQRFANLGGLTSIGQNAAAGVGNAGMTTSGQIINALQQSGAAQAGSALAAGQAQANLYGGIGSGIATLGMLKMMGKL